MTSLNAGSASVCTPTHTWPHENLLRLHRYLTLHPDEVRWIPGLPELAQYAKREAGLRRWRIRHQAKARDIGGQIQLMRARGYSWRVIAGYVDKSVRQCQRMGKL